MKIVWAKDAFYDVRRLPTVQARLQVEAQQLATRAGEGFAWSNRQGMRAPQGRWRAIVYPDSWSARARNRRDNTLVRVLG